MSKTELGVSALGGALLGAVAMYLLDPESGKERREYIGDAAGDAFGSAADRAKAAAAVVAERAGDWSAFASDKAHDFATNLSSNLSDKASYVGDLGSSLAGASYSGLRDRLGSLGHGLLDRARGFGHSASDAASDYADDITDRASRMSHPMRHRLARAIDPDHVRGKGHAVGWSAAGVGTLMLGAGLMYFLDPERGRARRAWCGQQVGRIVNRTGTTFRRTGQDLMNRVRGSAYQAQGQIRRAVASGSQGLSGDQLVQRLRSQLGHVLTYPSQVQLMADASGTVTLYGKVPQNEESRLLSTVHAVPGVNEIINRLEVCSSGVTLGSESPSGSTSMGGARMGTSSAAQI